jgi:peptide/nickel transport system ATP-binding protein
MTLLRVEGLRVEGRNVVAVDGASFAVARGEVLALVGESGSGKTMAARALLDLLPSGLRKTGGRIEFDGSDLAQATAARWRQIRGGEVGMVFQEPMVSLNPALSIGVQMAEGLRLHTALSAAEIREACLAMLARVQIADPQHCLDAYPHEFSGGMRQRIMLASVMLLRPKLLIADEPTTALDTLTQREVLDLMLALTRDHGTAVLLITHNLGLVARYAARAAVMRHGRVVETGDALDLLTHPRTGYTRELVDVLPRREAKSGTVAVGEPVLAAQGLAVEFNRKRLFRRGRTMRAVDGVDLEIRAGETVAVVGGSGSGKTTLGRALLNLVPASAGRIVFRGRPVEARDKETLRALRLACQIVFQDPYSSLDPRMRVAEIVDEPLRHLPELDRAARAARVAETLGEVGLAGYGARFPHELSGGQRQRVAIARAIVRRPSLIVADEPVSALDMTIQKQVLELFARLQRSHGFACMFVSHDLAAVEQIADRVVVMEKGRIVEQGPRDQIFDSPRHPYTRALLDAAPIFDPRRATAPLLKNGTAP